MSLKPFLINIRPDEDGPEENDQSTPTSNQQKSEESEDQRNADLLLSLNCSTRDQLITSLNQLSVVLQSNKQVPENEKQKICKKIDAAMQLLIDLSPFGPPQSVNHFGPFEEMVFGKLLVELSRTERSKIINHLIAVRDTVLFDDLIAHDVKPSLFTTNKRIINQLLDLPVKDQTDESDEDDGNESIAGLLWKQQKGNTLFAPQLSSENPLSHFFFSFQIPKEPDALPGLESPTGRRSPKINESISSGWRPRWVS